MKEVYKKEDEPIQGDKSFNVESVVDKVKGATSELLRKIRRIAEKPSITEPERTEAASLIKETERLEKGFNLISEELTAAGAEILEKSTVNWSDGETIKNFDIDLKPIKQIHSGVNSVFLCEHPKHGKVVIKIPSNKEEIDFLEKAKKIPGVVRMVEDYENKKNGKKETAILTKYIEGANLAMAIEKEGGWSIDNNGVIFRDKEKITTKEEVISKLRETVLTLHKSLDRACFDIKPVNILLDKEGNPYLFDFDIQFGASRGQELRKWFVQTLKYPLEFLSDKVIVGPLEAITGLISGEGFQGFKDWFSIPTLFPGGNLKNFREDFKNYKKDDLEDVENLFNSKYRCKSLFRFLLNLRPSDKRWNL
ncbi:MAG: hypothetical protein AAB432_01875 [Patescibacteria group bacterium]